MSTSTETTRETMLRYFESDHRDTGTLAQDVVFTVMATGEEHRGREAVLAMFEFFYHLAFDATARPRVTLFGERNALWEGEFAGRHIGEFAGIAATGKEVRVPLAVVYDLDDGKISQGRIYFEMPVLMRQLGVPGG